MLEWFALVLLVPVILIPLVLLFGFAGCNPVFGIEETELAFSDTFETVLDQDRGRDNRTIVQRLEPDTLTKSGSEVRITLQRPVSGNLVINNLFISRAANAADPAADPYDSATDFTPVIGAPLLLSPNPAEPELELPAFDYVLDETAAVLLAFDVAADGNVPRTATNLPPFQATAFLGPLPPPPPGLPVHEAALLDRQPGYEMESRIYLIKRIGVR